MTTPLDAHYRALGPLQPIQVIKAWSPSWGPHAYLLGNIVKYAARMFLKDTPLENVTKLRFYVEQLASLLEEPPGEAHVHSDPAPGGHPEAEPLRDGAGAGGVPQAFAGVPIVETNSSYREPWVLFGPLGRRSGDVR